MSYGQFISKYLRNDPHCWNRCTWADSVDHIRLLFELANNVDPDEVAHDEPPHLDLHCVPSLVFEFYDTA